MHAWPCKGGVCPERVRLPACMLWVPEGTPRMSDAELAGLRDCFSFPLQQFLHCLPSPGAKGPYPPILAGEGLQSAQLTPIRQLWALVVECEGYFTQF